MQRTRNNLDPVRLPPYLTPKEYAGLMRMSVVTVRRHMRAGLIPGVKVGPKLWRIPREAVMDH